MLSVEDKGYGLLSIFFIILFSLVGFSEIMKNNEDNSASVSSESAIVEYTSQQSLDTIQKPFYLFFDDQNCEDCKNTKQILKEEAKYPVFIVDIIQYPDIAKQFGITTPNSLVFEDVSNNQIHTELKDLKAILITNQ